MNIYVPTKNTLELKILQLNANRCRASHDITMALGGELDVDLIVFSEPNKKAVKG